MPCADSDGKKDGFFEECIFDVGRLGSGSQRYGDGGSTGRIPNGCGRGGDSGSSSGAEAGYTTTVAESGTRDQG